MLFEKANSPKVLLISMPWGPIAQPSHGISLLKSELKKHGVGCDVLEAGMLLLQWIKYITYVR
jgi:hypothetical protein